MTQPNALTNHRASHSGHGPIPHPTVLEAAFPQGRRPR